MIRRVLSMLFGVLVWSCTVSLVSAQAARPLTIAPPVANPYAGLNVTSGEAGKARKEINALRSKLHDGDLSEEESEKTTAELKKAAASLFDLEVKSMKKRVAQMQKEIDKRLADREKLVQARIKKLMTPDPKAGDINFQVQEVKKQDDGSSIAQVMFLRVEQRTRTVPVTEMRAEKRVRTVDGKKVPYTVQVPVQKTVEQTYTVQVPTGQKKVPVPKGTDVDEAVKKFLDAERDF